MKCHWSHIHSHDPSMPKRYTVMRTVHSTHSCIYIERNYTLSVFATHPP